MAEGRAGVTILILVLLLLLLVGCEDEKKKKDTSSKKISPKGVSKKVKEKLEYEENRLLLIRVLRQKLKEKLNISEKSKKILQLFRFLDDQEVSVEDEKILFSFLWKQDKEKLRSLFPQVKTIKNNIFRSFYFVIWGYKLYLHNEAKGGDILVNGLYFSLEPLNFLTLKDWKKLYTIFENRNSKEDMLLKILFYALSGKVYHALELLEREPITLKWKKKLKKVILNIEKRNYILPIIESSFSEKIKEQLEKVGYLYHKGEKVREYLYQILKNKNFSFWKEVYFYFFYRNVEIARVVIQIGKDLFKDKKYQRKIDYYLAKLYFKMGKIKEGISLLYGLWYSTLNKDEKESYYFLIKKYLPKVK